VDVILDFNTFKYGVKEMIQSDQNNISIISVGLSLLVGGFAGTVITQINGYFAERKDRKIRFLDEQLRKLYAPLFYFVSQSEKLFDLNKRFNSAYTKEYIEKQWSLAQSTQDHLEKVTNDTLEIANKYIKLVEENNKKIKKILDDNYSFIDPDDIELLLLFYENYVRLETEIDEKGVLKTPFRIYKDVGDISFLRPDIIEKIKDKFITKKSELERLVNKKLIRNIVKKE
jgi:hypothetical protein